MIIATQFRILHKNIFFLIYMNIIYLSFCLFSYRIEVYSLVPVII